MKNIEGWYNEIEAAIARGCPPQLRRWPFSFGPTYMLKLRDHDFREAALSPPANLRVS